MEKPYFRTRGAECIRNCCFHDQALISVIRLGASNEHGTVDKLTADAYTSVFVHSFAYVF